MGEATAPDLAGFAVSDDITDTSFAVAWSLADVGDDNKRGRRGVGDPAVSTTLDIAVFPKPGEGAAGPSVADVINGNGGTIFHDTVAVAQGSPDPPHSFNNTTGTRSKRRARRKWWRRCRRIATATGPAATAL
jgi:hypothetical protein